MLKNFINRVKNLVEQNVEQNKDSKESVEKVNKVEEIDIKENKELGNQQPDYNDISLEETHKIVDAVNVVEKETVSEIKDNKENLIQSNNQSKEDKNTNQMIEENNLKEIHDVDESKEVIKNNEKEIINEECTEEDKEYVKEIKIKRGKSIKAIDVYTKEPQIFKTHKECSKKLKIPMEYIQENLMYGYTDYLGEAIKYLSKELNIVDEEINYLESSKSPSQILNSLNNKIFTTKMSEVKRDEILCNEKIEPVKMHYIFECIDEEYDNYFKKYKSIIKRGGKKKIELVDKKGEVIEIFKSLDECAVFLNKEKSEVVDMLKYKNTKVGRNKIRYSLRNI